MYICVVYNSTTWNLSIYSGHQGDLLMQVVPDPFGTRQPCCYTVLFNSNVFLYFLKVYMVRIVLAVGFADHYVDIHCPPSKRVWN